MSDGLVSASPQRPCDDIAKSNSFSREPLRHSADFLDRPTDEDLRARARREFPVEIYAAGQLSQCRKKIRRLGARIETLNPEQLHRLRIQVKKSRYSIEFFSGLFLGKECAKRCRTIKSSLVKLQNSLGTIKDIVAHKSLFADIIARRTNSLAGEQNHHRAYATGLIIGDQQAQVQRSLDRAHKL